MSELKPIQIPETKIDEELREALLNMLWALVDEGSVFSEAVIYR